MKTTSNTFGISANSLKELQKILGRHKDKIQKVIVFGSRAMGNYKKSSDIDLAIVFKKEINFKDFLLPKAEFLNSEIIPYGVDLINLEKVDNLE